MNVLTKTIVPIVDWPEQGIVERLLLVKHEAAKVGVIVEWSDEVRNSSRRWAPLRIRRIPLVEAIKFMTSGTVLMCKIKAPNVLYFHFYSEMPISKPDPDHPISPGHPDPFDPRHHDPLVPEKRKTRCRTTVYPLRVEMISVATTPIPQSKARPR